MQIEYYSPVSGGAIATIIMQHARRLIERGHKVTVLTVANGDETYPVGEVVRLQAGSRETLNFFQRRLSGLRRRLHGWDYPYYEHYLRSFRRELKKLSPAPDVVIVHNDLVTPQYVKQVLPHTKVILALQNEQRTNLRDVNPALSSIDMFAPVGEYIRGWTAKQYSLPDHRFVNIGNGVDLRIFKPRANYLEPVNPVRVLFIGRLDPNKGPDLVADSVAALRKEGLPVTLSVAGGLWFYGHGNEMANPYFRELKEKMDAAEAGYLGHVVRHDVPALIRDHDIVCILSRSQDPYPLVTLEAMASGCAVIASNRGGLPEASGGAAMLVDPDDFGSVVKAMRTLVTNPAFLKEQKEKGIKRAAVASWETRTDILENTLTGQLGLS